jgi:hypothetical protein
MYYVQKTKQVANRGCALGPGSAPAPTTFVRIFARNILACQSAAPCRAIRLEGLSSDRDAQRAWRGCRGDEGNCEHTSSDRDVGERVQPGHLIEHACEQARKGGGRMQRLDLPKHGLNETQKPDNWQRELDIAVSRKALSSRS